MMTQEFDTPDSSDPIPEPPITSADFAPADEDHTSEAEPLKRDVVATHRPLSNRHSSELRALTLAIEVHPESAANYAARGDFFRHHRDFGQAVADYQQALDLAEQELAQSSWGIAAQALRDQILNALDELGDGA